VSSISAWPSALPLPKATKASGAQHLHLRMSARIMQSNRLIKGFRQYLPITYQNSTDRNLADQSSAVGLLYG
jgi:hypothetical protein